MQGLAFQPGVSRSGEQLALSDFLESVELEAGKLTFLMSLPVIAGAGLVKIFEVEIPSEWIPPFLIGMGAAAISGWLSIHWLIQLVSKTNFKSIATYRVAVGIFVLLLLLFGFR